MHVQNKLYLHNVQSLQISLQFGECCIDKPDGFLLPPLVCHEFLLSFKKVNVADMHYKYII